MRELYGSIDVLDGFVGGLCERHIPGGSVGRLFATIITEQFTRLRDGDPFWYENIFTPSEVATLKAHVGMKTLLRAHVPHLVHEGRITSAFHVLNQDF